MTDVLTELARESRMGGEGTENRDREIRRISLADFDRRRGQIIDELWVAAADIGFFQVVDHGIDLELVRQTFAAAEEFFALPDRVKERYPRKAGANAGWETSSQVRPSTGTPDQKESFQVTRTQMDGLWPDVELAGFRRTVSELELEVQCWSLAMRLLDCFADRLGLPAGFFTEAHDPGEADYQSTLRLLHYFAMDEVPDAGLWRAGAHTDFDCLTLLFQRAGQSGLQVCPGAERESEEWTPVVATDDAITCNIGDMLMRWSDDLLPSTLHRVRNPGPQEFQGARYSMAFFAQANRGVLVEGPQRTYPAISAGDYLQQRIAANFRPAL